MFLFADTRSPEFEDVERLEATSLKLCPIGEFFLCAAPSSLLWTVTKHYSNKRDTAKNTRPFHFIWHPETFLWSFTYTLVLSPKIEIGRPASPTLGPFQLEPNCHNATFSEEEYLSTFTFLLPTSLCMLHMSHTFSEIVHGIIISKRLNILQSFLANLINSFFLIF